MDFFYNYASVIILVSVEKLTDLVLRLCPNLGPNKYATSPPLCPRHQTFSLESVIWTGFGFVRPNMLNVWMNVPEICSICPFLFRRRPSKVHRKLLLQLLLLHLRVHRRVLENNEIEKLTLNTIYNTVI